LKGPVDFLVPPAGVPEFDDIATGGIELAHNRVQPRLCVAVARRQLKQEAAHLLAQNIGEEAKIPYERFGALEPSYMSDEFTDFDSVNELFLAGLTDAARPGRWQPSATSKRRR